jgi:diacylglycerol kinase family enzyme
MTKVRELRIDGEEETRVHLDGEPFGMLPVDLTVREAAVAVAAPIG